MAVMVLIRFAFVVAVLSLLSHGKMIVMFLIYYQQYCSIFYSICLSPIPCLEEYKFVPHSLFGKMYNVLHPLVRRMYVCPPYLPKKNVCLFPIPWLDDCMSVPQPLVRRMYVHPPSLA
jgi:hypothetical protein